jgi:hypothetical protein
LKKRDFTIKAYSRLLDTLVKTGYEFQTFRDYLLQPKERVAILRHDVDRWPKNSLIFAEIESHKLLKASYYFRIVPESCHLDIIEKIQQLGHEIGYHYEDLASAKGDVGKGIASFKKNLDYLRTLTQIDTICMHGSPFSRFDNRELWNHYDYRDSSIIGEPYFDLDFNEVFYITDTGRKWNNESASIRDKVQSKFNIKVSNTNHFIELILAGEIPDRIMINTHPQRWNDDWRKWLLELLGQNMKNLVKRILTHKPRLSI